MKQKYKKYLYTLLFALIIIAIMTIILHLEGRISICECGYVKLWYNQIVTPEDSQHLFDWYAFTHVLHGLAIYFILWVIDRKKKLNIKTKFLIAVGIAAGWEILENSPMIIDRYRAATISLNYYGDSIINSIGDVISMSLGFWFAHKMKIWYSIVLFILIESVLAYIIRDNLTINIVMLIHPIEAIKFWQQGL